MSSNAEDVPQPLATDSPQETRQPVEPAPATNGSKPGKRAVVVVQQQNGADTDEGEDDDEASAEEDGADDGDSPAEFPEDTEDVELVHAQLQSAHLARLGLPRLAAHLKRLCLRQNQISALDPAVFGALVHLQELDLYDNRIRDRDVGDALDALAELSVLDLSFNLLRAVPEGLRHLTCLKTVYFVQNRITKISGLDSLGATLRSLELGGNKLRKIENLESLVNLEELWLGKNKIARLEGLQTLARLKILSIQSNRITNIEGLEELKGLEELYVSHNGIEKLEGLDGNLNLRVLDVGNNFIVDVENIAHLSRLEEFWASGNRIASLRTLEPQLAQLSALETVYLEGNPCQRDDVAGYRRKIMLALPQLKQIDATYVK